MRRKTTRSWCWRRWMVSGAQELWMERLESEGCASWVFLEQPQRVRVLLEAYLGSRGEVLQLAQKWGGSFREVNAQEWFKPSHVPPTRIGNGLEIVHEKPRGRAKPERTRLFIPHGLAFGSGEHATTYMLLRELARRTDWSRMSVLDLGTGSGVLALAARLFGAQKIVATDFDAEAVRTARQNEALNFKQPGIRWQCADVKKLRATARYQLVLANLFSGILGEAAPQIAGSVSPGGELWLSGILKTQEAEVAAAYKKQGMQMMRAFRRGKWVMLRLLRPA